MILTWQNPVPLLRVSRLSINKLCVAASLTFDVVAAETTDVAAPLKSLVGDEPEAAPAGGILASLASAVGLGGSSTSPDTTTVHDQGQEPISGMTGQGTVDHPYDAGNEDDPSLGGKANTLTTTNDGLQFVGGNGGANTGNDHTGQTQSHTSIAQAVNEGALGGSQDPAQSNDGLAFVCKSHRPSTLPIRLHSNIVIQPATTNILLSHSYKRPATTSQSVELLGPTPSANPSARRKTRQRDRR